MNLADITNQIIQGDCIEVMSEMPENSIDTIITDPPYGLEFMGKEWDKFKEGTDNIETNKKNPYYRSNVRHRIKKDVSQSAFQKWTRQWAIEALRVAKPGATLLCFGGTRTYHRLVCAIEDAGWVIKDCIMWLYGSGFPKAHDIGKSVEKIKVGGIKNLKKIGTKKGIKVETGTQGYSYSKEYAAGKCMGGKQISGDIPVYEINNEWNGWKSHGLKPAYEPILVAMKPNEGSYANNALKHGVSGLNIDGGRVGTEEMGGGTMPDLRDVGAKSKEAIGIDKLSFGQVQNAKRKSYDNKIIGRFPANILLDEEAARMLDEQSGESKGSDTKRNRNTIGSFGMPNDDTPEYSDRGGASRFFYVAKTSKSERNMGCEGMKNNEPAYKSHRANYKNTKGIETPYAGTGRGGKEFKNNHPTVKPIKLMEYLCLLTKTPTGGIVLDPFVGSGTTCIAAKRQNRDFIGIEKEPEYCEIARARIKAQAKPMF